MYTYLRSSTYNLAMAWHPLMALLPAKRPLDGHNYLGYRLRSWIAPCAGRPWQATQPAAIIRPVSLYKSGTGYAGLAIYGSATTYITRPRDRRLRTPTIPLPGQASKKRQWTGLWI